MLGRVVPPEPPLSDGVVTLRPWRLDDVPAVAAACAEEEIARWLDQIPQPYRADDARMWIEQNLDAWRTGTFSNFAIVDAGSGEVLGSMGGRVVDAGDEVVEVGYWVKAAARGRGVATRGLRLISVWLLDDVGAARVQLRADELNAPSRRVAERAGFTEEGVLRSSHYNPRLGRRVDFVMYSLLPDDPR